MKNILFKFLFVFILSGAFYVNAQEWGDDLSGECPTCETTVQTTETTAPVTEAGSYCISEKRVVIYSDGTNTTTPDSSCAEQPSAGTVSGTVVVPVGVIQTNGYYNYTRGVSVQPSYQLTNWGVVSNRQQTYVQPTPGQPATTTQPVPVNGECGQSNGKTLSSPPTNTCSAGKFSSPSGVGPWYWLCTGVNGGITVSCSAQKAQPTPTPGPTYATSTNNNNTNTVYQPTNWGTVTNRAQTYNVAPVYQNTNTVYQPTNWGSNTGNYNNSYTNNNNYNNAQNYDYNPSVTTTSVTDIDQTSARCNGAATYAPSTSYNGYFEYGLTPELGEYTRQVNIGQGGVFSRGIAGLSPGTKYYCKAVIVGTAGIYRGNLQSFRTLKDTVKYVPKVSTITRSTDNTSTSKTSNTKVVTNTSKNTTVKKIATTTTQVNKNVIVCADGTGNTEELKEGEKFVDIAIVNIKQPTTGGEAEYKITYRNKSRINLGNVYMKFSVPQQYNYISGPGQVDGSDVIIQKSTLSPGESGEYIIKFKVKDEVKAKTNIVMSSYVYYEMLSEDGTPMSDDNTAHLVSTVINGDNSILSLDMNPLSSGSALLKWLIVIGLIFILFILGKKIKDEYQNKKYGKQVLSAHH